MRELHFAYLLRCADGTLYSGYTRDLESREARHNAGKGGRYTAGRRPVRVVYSESFETQQAAMARGDHDPTFVIDSDFCCAAEHTLRLGLPTSPHFGPLAATIGTAAVLCQRQQSIFLFMSQRLTRVRKSGTGLTKELFWIPALGLQS